VVSTSVIIQGNWCTSVSFWPVRNLVQLSDGPSLYTRWQEQGIFVLFHPSIHSCCHRTSDPNFPFNKNMSGK